MFCLETRTGNLTCSWGGVVPPLPWEPAVTLGQGPPSTMVKLSCSFSGKSGKETGGQEGTAMDSVPLISPLDVSQLQPSFSDQVVIKTQTEYQLTSSDQPKKFADLEGQRLACGNPEEGRRMPTARMIAFAMALMGCVLIMYKAIWYDQFSCPDGFLLRHKICTPLTLEMYYTEMDPERHRSILAAIGAGAYPLNHKHGTEMPAVWGNSYRASKEEHKGPTPAAVVVSAAAAAASAAGTEPSGRPLAMREKEDPQKAEGMPSQAPQ